MDIEKFTDVKFWNDVHNKKYRNKEFYNYKHYAHKIFCKYLKPNANLSILEIGCVPRRNLIYFAKTFGYQPDGIDFSDKIYDLPHLLSSYGINNFQLIHEDFLKFTSDRKYDIVCSFGFVEHFTNPSLIFKKHTTLLKENGYAYYFFT